MSQIFWRRYRHEAHVWTKSHGNHVARYVVMHADPGVESAGDDVDKSRVHHELDLNLAILVHKRGRTFRMSADAPDSDEVIRIEPDGRSRTDAA